VAAAQPGASSFVIGLDAFVIAAPAWILTLVGGVLAAFVP
jgi:hypothetical protein